MLAYDPAPLLAKELSIPVPSVSSVLKLLADGNTVPFIARYRKEVTGSLDEVQIRTIEERKAYLVELEDRRTTIRKSIEESGKLTPDLADKIARCTTKTALEDLYLPYRPKRRTRAIIARERGLEPLAQLILTQPKAGSPKEAARGFTSGEGVDTEEEALAGARDIIAEMVAENAEIRSHTRRIFKEEGLFVSTVSKKQSRDREPTKFEAYYDFRESVKTIPSHRYLAIVRGEAEKILSATIEVDEPRLLLTLERTMSVVPSSPFAGELKIAIADSYQRLLAPSIETELRNELKERSDAEAIRVFAENLRELLLAPPLGGQPVIGIDPGLRTGSKCVALDATGKYLASVTLHLLDEGKRLERARNDLLDFVKRHSPKVIAIGNGTGGRETEKFVRDTLSAHEVLRSIPIVQVNEAGASVYSASEIAREEHPDLDLTLRGAISIARRLQDPLAELVKIDPKAIGVGQYQHDVRQTLLKQKLEEVVESCVNHVGVDLNTASGALLSYVAGFGPKLTQNIVTHRNESGAFSTKEALLKVNGLGKRAFEQSAGFLRIPKGRHPLDASAVHPERYDIVELMAKDLGVALQDLVGNPSLVERLDLDRYVQGDVGRPTLLDIVEELRKPGRDPRERFEPPQFRDDVQAIEDLQPGMQLEGVVTNVTAFGAFVDIGVHQDGLVHVSQLADHFVKAPSDVVKVGQKLKVHVLDVDVARRRISLSAKASGKPPVASTTSPSEFRNNPFTKMKDRPR